MAENKKGSFGLIFAFMILTMIIAFNWEKWTWLKGGIHKILDPSLGALLNWNLTIGMFIIVLLLSFLTTILQKYTTDQKELKKIRDEQKEIQNQTKKFRDSPEKLMKLQKRQMELMPKQMKLGMSSVIYTGIPLILFFRWFQDYFLVLNNPKFFGFLSWFWFYLIFSIIFSSIIKKKLDIV